ncbi:uncharacterized protein METZ01_LOCUS65621 [marine metagenome]|uniref:Uncharacterized protein n=1 Tax=marine metagenome TaxID=408172 RepID=A0A381TDH2_9ZZZZ
MEFVYGVGVQIYFLNRDSSWFVRIHKFFSAFHTYLLHY